MVSRNRLDPKLLKRYDALIQERVTLTVAPFRPALVPLFSHKRRRPEIIGTGVAVAARDARLILTAAHVIRDFADDTIFVPHNGGWVTLAGIAHSATTPGWTDLEDDRLDAAILELDEKSRGHWSGWLAPAHLSPGAPASEDDRFIVTGFPRTKLKYDFAKGSVGPRAIPIFARPAPKSQYRSLRISPEAHVALIFNREKQIQDGQQVAAPSPRGISGGMLLSAPGVLKPELFARSGLAGIFIEWPSPKRFLVSTRIDVHLKLLHERLPALSDLFPRPITMS